MHIRCAFLGLFLAIAPSALAFESRPLPILAPLENHGPAAHLSAEFLSRYAYKRVPLDDALSEAVMNRFIKALDPDRLFFLQSDIDAFMADGKKIDDAILQEDLRVPFSIFNVYEQRMVERMTHARDLLSQDFDFAAKEDYSLQRDKEPWARSDADIDDVWRKRVKGDWLRLKLAGQSDEAIRATLGKRYENSLERVYKYRSDDVFQSFMEAYTTSIDPHTDYFGASASAEFDISMKLSLVGIGAVLQERDDYTTIRELVPGGPAQLSGKLAVGDRIIGVGQGEGAAVKDVVGTRLDEVVQMIRGEKDSKVVLDILPADAVANGTHRSVVLVRDKISLDKQAAKKTILTVGEGATARRIGVITLPAFYEDFEAHRKGDADYRSASRDVAKLIEELKQDKVDGLLVDLRDNGGGSLTEAIDLTGLFVGKGPVVQQRSSDGKIKIESDDDPAPAWAGPLGVLINRGSASASEIFAAAIQDYGRGVVVGEPSFGKGTVQTVIDLDQAAHASKLGQLKLTIAQFFRIDGGTTQLRGVTPDIGLPGLSDPTTFGESSYDNALAWTQIKPAKYKAAGDIAALLPQLQDRHDARAKTDPDFQRFLQDAADLKAEREKKTLSLNLAERRAEMEAREKRFKERDAASRGIEPGLDDGLQANERSLNAELAMENARKNAKDVLRNEAAAVVSDAAGLLDAKHGADAN